jgi:hypothetical protein
MLKHKLIVLYMARKRMKAAAIHQDQFITLGLDGVSCPTVTRILREARFMHKGFLGSGTVR